MYIVLLTIMALLSLSPISKTVENMLLKYRKFISKLLLVLAYLTLLLVFSDIALHETGERALDLLWILLWLPILGKVFDLGIAKKLMLFRKEIGIWMGTMAFVHATKYFLTPNPYMPWTPEYWIVDGFLNYIAWGTFAIIITAILTFTSNNYSIKNMGKSWKLLHRTVYFLILFTLFHVTFFEIQDYGYDLYITFILTFIPFGLYIIGKILEWRKVKIILSLKKYLIGGAIIVIGILVSGQVKELNVSSESTTSTSNTTEQIIVPSPEITENNSISTEIVQEEIVEVPEVATVLATNYLSIIETCDSLCGSDSETYCTSVNEVVFGENQVTYGTCRTLSKYNQSFNRCEGFCQSYGGNKGPSSFCTLPDGTSDRNCDGL